MTSYIKKHNVFSNFRDFSNLLFSMFFKDIYTSFKCLIYESFIVSNVISGGNVGFSYGDLCDSLCIEQVWFSCLQVEYCFLGKKGFGLNIEIDMVAGKLNIFKSIYAAYSLS